MLVSIFVLTFAFLFLYFLFLLQYIFVCVKQQNVCVLVCFNCLFDIFFVFQRRGIKFKNLLFQYSIILF